MDAEVREFFNHLFSTNKYSLSTAKNRAYYHKHFKELIKNDELDKNKTRKYLFNKPTYIITTLERWLEWKKMSKATLYEILKEFKRIRGISVRRQRYSRKKPRRWATKQEIQQVIEFIKNDKKNRRKKRDIIMIKLFFETTIRVSELVKIKLSDIVTDNNGKHYIEGFGKGNKKFKEYISDELYNEIKEYYKTKGLYAEEYLFHSPTKKLKIFRNDMITFTHLSRQAVHNKINKIWLRALGKRFHPHALKTSSLKYCEQVLKLPISKLKLKGHHSDERTTLTYLDVEDAGFDDEKPEIAEKLSL